MLDKTKKVEKTAEDLVPKEYHKYLKVFSKEELERMPMKKPWDPQMFTKIDLIWGYNNIHIKEGDNWKAAFICHRGAFKLLVMFFGLYNSPSTFQTMMNEIFADMEDVVVVYIDNIMIFIKTDDPKKHNKIVLEVLHHLEENDLYRNQKNAHSIPQRLISSELL